MPFLPRPSALWPLVGWQKRSRTSSVPVKQTASDVHDLVPRHGASHPPQTGFRVRRHIIKFIDATVAHPIFLPAPLAKINCQTGWPVLRTYHLSLESPGLFTAQGCLPKRGVRLPPRVQTPGLKFSSSRTGHGREPMGSRTPVPVATPRRSDLAPDKWQFHH